MTSTQKPAAAKANSKESKKTPATKATKAASSKSKIPKQGTGQFLYTVIFLHFRTGERGGSVVECRTPEREVRGSRPTSAMLCPWARHFTPRKYWLITQEAMAPSRHDWKIVDWDVKPQHNQPTFSDRQVSSFIP